MTVGCLKRHTGHTAVLQIFAVAPSSHRGGNPRCSLQIGEGPALQMPEAGDARNEETTAAASPLS
jgi:hypothetical protein